MYQVQRHPVQLIRSGLLKLGGIHYPFELTRHARLPQHSLLPQVEGRLECIAEDGEAYSAAGGAEGRLRTEKPAMQPALQRERRPVKARLQSGPSGMHVPRGRFPEAPRGAMLTQDEQQFRGEHLGGAQILCVCLSEARTPSVSGVVASRVTGVAWCQRTASEVALPFTGVAW